MDVIFFETAIVETDRSGRIVITLYDGSRDLRAEPLRVATLCCFMDTARTLVRDLVAATGE